MLFYHYSQKKEVENDHDIIISTIYFYNIDKVLTLTTTHVYNGDSYYDATVELEDLLSDFYYTGIDVSGKIDDYLLNLSTDTSSRSEYTRILHLGSQMSDFTTLPFSTVISSLSDMFIESDFPYLYPKEAFTIGSYINRSGNYYYFDNCKIYYHEGTYSKVTLENGVYKIEGTDRLFYSFSLYKKNDTRIETTCCVLACCEPDKYKLV